MLDSNVTVEVTMDALIEIEVAVEVEILALELGLAVDTDDSVKYDSALTLLASRSSVGFFVDYDGAEKL